MIVCTFFGHKDTPFSIKEALKQEIIKLIEEEAVDVFWVGNNGAFDLIVQQTLEEVRLTKSEINYYIVLSSHGEKAISGNIENTVLPEELVKSLPKFAISKRNELMIKSSKYAVCYFKKRFSNCEKWVKLCEKRGLSIVFL